MVFEARPDYYLGPAKISRIVWRQVPDSSSRLALLLSAVPLILHSAWTRKTSTPLRIPRT